MSVDKETLDSIFCHNAKKYKLPKLWLKSVALCESSMNQRAYRYEPAFWQRYLKDNPKWNTQDPAVVSASYGLMQLMWTTAWELGFRGTQEDLYNPVYNIELGAKLIRQLLDRIIEAKLTETYPWWSPLDIAMARYNGGRTGNPNDKGEIRNRKYALRVRREWINFTDKEAEC